MVWTPDTAEIEDGTGKSGAVVYEAPATGITWLNTRGKTSFSGASDPLQEQHAVEAVEEAQDILVEWGFEAPPSVSTQSLLFPARGAYGSRNELFDPDELPTALLEAIRLIEEEKAAGTWMAASSSATRVIKARSAPGASVEYRDGAVGALEYEHPAIYRRLRRCLL